MHVKLDAPVWQPNTAYPLGLLTDANMGRDRQADRDQWLSGTWRSTRRHAGEQPLQQPTKPGQGSRRQRRPRPERQHASRGRAGSRQPQPVQLHRHPGRHLRDQTLMGGKNSFGPYDVTPGRQRQRRRRPCAADRDRHLGATEPAWPTVAYSAITARRSPWGPPPITRRWRRADGGVTWTAICARRRRAR